MMCVQLIRFQNKIACIDLIWLFLRQNAHFGIDRPTRLKWVGPQSAHGVTRHLWLKSCLHSVLFPWDEITIFVLLPRERRDGWKNDCLGVWTNPMGLQAHELTVTRTGAFPHCSISQGTDINGNSLFCFSAAPFRVFTYETLIQKHKNTYWHSYWHWRQNSHTHRLRLKLILTFSNSHWHSVWHWAGQEDKTLKATSMSCHLILFYDQLFFPTAELRIHKFLLRVTFQ